MTFTEIISYYKAGTTAHCMASDTVTCMGTAIMTYNILVEKAEWKKPLERHRNRWEDNIKISREQNMKMWAKFG
jgi:hypothetical protein